MNKCVMVCVCVCVSLRPLCSVSALVYKQRLLLKKNNKKKKRPRQHPKDQSSAALRRLPQLRTLSLHMLPLTVLCHTRGTLVTALDCTEWNNQLPGNAVSVQLIHAAIRLYIIDKTIVIGFCS